MAHLIEAAADCAYVEDQVGMSAKGNLIGDESSFGDFKCIIPMRYNLPSGGCMNRGEDVGLMSGADSRGIQTSMTLRTTGQSATDRSAYVLVQTTATLLVGAGQAVSVVN